MKFLLNMNISRELGKLSISQGNKCRHVGDIGLARAEDIDIVAEAKEKQEIILTGVTSRARCWQEVVGSAVQFERTWVG